MPFGTNGQTKLMATGRLRSADADRTRALWSGAGDGSGPAMETVVLGLAGQTAPGPIATVDRFVGGPPEDSLSVRCEDTAPTSLWATLTLSLGEVRSTLAAQAGVPGAVDFAEAATRATQAVAARLREETDATVVLANVEYETGTDVLEAIAEGGPATSRPARSREFVATVWVVTELGDGGTGEEKVPVQFEVVDETPYAEIRAVDGVPTPSP